MPEASKPLAKPLGKPLGKRKRDRARLLVQTSARIRV